MKHHRFTFIGLLIASVLINACSQEKAASSWNPNVRILDAAAKDIPKGAVLAHDVKAFYQLLRDKQWHETYERRAKVFRNDVKESDYLIETKYFESGWGLANYEVLSLEFQDSDVAILICKFTELPNYQDSYSTVFWHKEEGSWKCL